MAAIVSTPTPDAEELGALATAALTVLLFRFQKFDGNTLNASLPYFLGCFDGLAAAEVLLFTRVAVAKIAVCHDFYGGIW